MDEQRRLLIKAGAAAMMTSGLSGAAAAEGAKIPPGKPGDFDFLAGEWRIKHRRPSKEPGKEFDHFEGEATCWTILGGVGSVEELRIPARDFSGLGLRLLDVEKKIWSDFWVNAKSGVLTAPGQTGGFEDGVGVFGDLDIGPDVEVAVRGIWDEITPTSCRWRQLLSRDRGKTWSEDWLMHWTRAGS